MEARNLKSCMEHWVLHPNPFYADIYIPYSHNTCCMYIYIAIIWSSKCVYLDNRRLNLLGYRQCCTSTSRRYSISHDVVTEAEGTYADVRPRRTDDCISDDPVKTRRNYTYRWAIYTSVPGVRSSNELDEVFLCDVAGCRPYRASYRTTYPL